MRFFTTVFFAVSFEAAFRAGALFVTFFAAVFFAAALLLDAVLCAFAEITGSNAIVAASDGANGALLTDALGYPNPSSGRATRLDIS